MITKFQCKILKRALQNKGFDTDGPRETDAARYLFEKKYLRRSRDGKHEYEITQEGEVAIKVYFQDISRFWITTVLSVIALITGLFSISIQSEPLLQLLRQLAK